MRKVLTLAALVAGLAAGAAMADDDDDGCRLPMAMWQTREAVALMAESRGWEVRRIKTDDGCYEVDGWDAEGRRIEALIHPGTLEILEIEMEDDEGGGRRGGARSPDGRVVPAPLQPLTPPANGLFTPGSRPNVEVR